MTYEVLDCPMGPNDAEASTIREYLVALLGELWAAQDGFSGKRPFGNSGWESEIYTALVAAGLVTGQLDEDGYLEDVDDQAADALVQEAITTLGKSQSATNHCATTVMATSDTDVTREPTGGQGLREAVARAAAILAVPDFAALIADAERVRRVRELAETWERRGRTYSDLGERDKAHDVRTRATALRRALNGEPQS